MTLTAIKVAPAVTISAAAEVNGGAAYVLSLLASGDPGADAITSWTIDGGDGGVQTITGSPSSASHVYADGPDPFAVAATATDEDGSYGSNALLANTRLDPTGDGKLDTTFDGDGVVVTSLTTGGESISDVAVQGDGKILRSAAARRVSSGGRGSRAPQGCRGRRRPALRRVASRAGGRLRRRPEV